MEGKLLDTSKLSQTDIEKIKWFCGGGCDHFVCNPKGSVLGCSSPTKTDSQLKSVGFDECSDAQKDGVSGVMTQDGFFRVPTPF